jgi:hypothetical protein
MVASSLDIWSIKVEPTKLLTYSIKLLINTFARLGRQKMRRNFASHALTTHRHQHCSRSAG